MAYENRAFILKNYDLFKDPNPPFWQSKEVDGALHSAYRATHILHDLAIRYELMNLNLVTSIMVAILEKLATTKVWLNDELMVNLLIELSKQIGTFLDHIVDKEELPELSIVYCQHLLVYLYNYQGLDLFQEQQGTVDELLQCDWQLNKLKRLMAATASPQHQ